jgi:hypothetical protein
MENFGKFSFGLLSIVITVLFGGFVFMTLWEWFVVYSFNVSALTLIQSVGVMFFWGYLKAKRNADEKLTWKIFLKDTKDSLMFHGIALGIGWIITLFQ